MIIMRLAVGTALGWLVGWSAFIVWTSRQQVHLWVWALVGALVGLGIGIVSVAASRKRSA
jgi:hypothetical protein